MPRRHQHMESAFLAAAGLDASLDAKAVASTRPRRGLDAASTGLETSKPGLRQQLCISYVQRYQKSRHKHQSTYIPVHGTRQSNDRPTGARDSRHAHTHTLRVLDRRAVGVLGDGVRRKERCRREDLCYRRKLDAQHQGAASRRVLTRPKPESRPSKCAMAVSPRSGVRVAARRSSDV